MFSTTVRNVCSDSEFEALDDMKSVEIMYADHTNNNKCVLFIGIFLDTQGNYKYNMNIINYLDSSNKN